MNNKNNTFAFLICRKLKNILPMTKTTLSTNKKSNNKQKGPKESSLRAILEFASSYRFQKVNLLNIEYSLN